MKKLFALTTIATIALCSSTFADTLISVPNPAAVWDSTTGSIYSLNIPGQGQSGAYIVPNSTNSSLVAGTNITITGNWPNQTINSTGSGGTPGGTSGQLQINNSSAFGGITVSGDATIGSTGVATVVGINGLKVVPPSDTSGQSIAIGSSALLGQPSGTADNIAIGYQSTGALSTMTTNATSNVAIGYQTLSLLTSGKEMVAIGRGALQQDTTGYSNIAIGYNALLYDNTGYQNDEIGHDAGNGNTTGVGNTGMGEGVLFGNFATYANSNNNTAIGNSALLNIGSNTSNNVAVGQGSLGGGIGSFFTGNNNTAVGTIIGSNMVTGNTNILMGYGVAATLNGGSSNIIIGGDVQNATVTGAVIVGETAKGASNETVVGYGALAAGGAGFHDTAIGYNAGALVTGGRNTIIGDSVGSLTLTTGSNNILVGVGSSGIAGGADTTATSTSNMLNIGGLIYQNLNSSAAPAVTACGTNSIDTRANNHSGTVNITAGTPSSCTITFAGTGFATWNHCRVTSESTNAAFQYSYSLTVLTLTGTALAGKVDYDCDGY